MSGLLLLSSFYYYYYYYYCCCYYYYYYSNSSPPHYAQFTALSERIIRHTTTQSYCKTWRSEQKVKFTTGLLIFVTEDVAATCTPLCRTFLCLEVGNFSCVTSHLQLSTPQWRGQDVARFKCHFSLLYLFPGARANACTTERHHHCAANTKTNKRNAELAN